jgi:hypothetical protein
MKLVSSILRIFLATALTLSTVSFASQAALAPTWSLGFWRLAHDDDGLGISDVLEIRKNGTWVNYTPRCDTSKGLFDVFHDDLIVVSERKKGPTAIVFRANSEHTRLTFTSPRTLNNSIYERVASPIPCAIVN